MMSASANEFDWGKYDGLMRSIVRGTIERAIRREDGSHDPYVLEELASEAMAQVWMYLPNPAECRDDQQRAAWSAYRAARRVIGGTYLAGCPIERLPRGSSLRPLDDGQRARLACWRTIDDRAASDAWDAAWRAVARLSAQHVRVAHLLADRPTIGTREMARRIECSHAWAGRLMRDVRATAAHAVGRLAEWRLAEIDRI